MIVWLQRGRRRVARADSPEMILLSCPETGALEGVRATPELLEVFEGADRGWFIAQPIQRGWDIQGKAPAGFEPAANAA